MFTCLKNKNYNIYYYDAKTGNIKFIETFEFKEDLSSTDFKFIDNENILGISPASHDSSGDSYIHFLKLNISSNDITKIKRQVSNAKSFNIFNMFVLSSDYVCFINNALIVLVDLKEKKLFDIVNPNIQAYPYDEKGQNYILLSDNKLLITGGRNYFAIGRQHMEYSNYAAILELKN